MIVDKEGILKYSEGNNSTIIQIMLKTLVPQVMSMLY